MSSNDQAKAATPQTSATACCSSPAAMCYWCMVSLVAWGFLSLVGIYWHPLNADSAATILFSGAIGCFANWFRNRTFHCRITAWLFLASGVVFLLANLDMIKIESRFVWLLVAVGTILAFILEWRYAHRIAR